MAVTSTELHAAALEAVAMACTVCRFVSDDLVGARLTKDDRSPVTVADFASQAVIIRHLQRRLGAVSMIAEETSDALRSPDNSALLDRVVGATRQVWPDADADAVIEAIDGGSRRDDDDAYWTLDPIDGTKGFLRRGQYAVSLAYMDDGIPTFGVLGCPNLSADFARPFADPDPHGLLYHAASGTGVLAVPADDPAATPKRLAALPASVGQIRCVESVEAAHSRQSDVGRILERAGLPSSRQQADSQAKYAVVARGQAELFMRVPTDITRSEYIWDHAAGAAVAAEAGVVVSDMRGRPLDFRAGDRLSRNYGIVCAHPHVHDRVIEAISALDLIPDSAP